MKLWITSIVASLTGTLVVAACFRYPSLQSLVRIGHLAVALIALQIAHACALLVIGLAGLAARWNSGKARAFCNFAFFLVITLILALSALWCQSYLLMGFD